RAADVVLYAELEVVIARARQTRHGQRRGRRLAVHVVDQRRRILGRGVVHEDARRRGEGRAGRRVLDRLDGVGDKAGPLTLGGGRLQQAAGRVAQHLARQRIDRLNQPAGDVALQIDAGADAQDKAVAADEVEIALEETAARRDVDVDIADLDVAEAERVG